MIHKINKMDEMQLFDILTEIIYPDIIECNDTSNVEYFEQRVENEGVTTDLVDEAVGILEELLNAGELEEYVNAEEPSNRENRKKNLNELVSVCEKLAGVGKSKN